MATAQNILSDKAIKAAIRAAQAESKARKISDGGGLVLDVRPTGTGWWRMRYWLGRKEGMMSLGTYPVVRLSDARSRRDEARTLLAQGINPSDQRKADKERKQAADANTVEAVGRAYLAIKKDGWSASHYERESRILGKDVFPYLGSRAIADVEPPELLKVCRRVEDRGAIEGARRVRITCSGVWQFAIAEGKATRDVTKDFLKALQPRVKGKHPAIIDPMQLGELLRACDAYKGGPVVRTALYVAPILFQRPGNLRSMRWADLNLDAGLWTIPSADMKRTVEGKVHGAAHLVPLPHQVVEAIRELQPLTGHREYVFTGGRDPKRPMSEAAVGAALNALGFKGIQCWHGYRATGRTILREVFKVDPDVLEAQLAHVGSKSHGGAYDRATFVDERVPLLQRWADYLDQLRQGPQVAPLRPAA